MKRIVGIRRLEESTIRLGGCGDNWHMSWADNDKVYVGMCDGTGLPGTPLGEYNSRAYAITGTPPDLRFEFLPGYPDLKSGSRYYNFGILALDGRIYQYLSTPDRPFLDPYGPRFVGAKLIYSPDDGRTWCNQDGSSPVTWEPWEKRSRAKELVEQAAGKVVSTMLVAVGPAPLHLPALPAA